MPMLNIKGSHMYYTVKGEGIPIVLIHPPLLTSANFMYQVEQLSKKYKVITFDMRGHGRSVYSKQPLTYSLIVEDMICLLDALQIEKAFIGGYSTGGTITLAFLLAHADRALGGIVISGMSEVKDVWLRQRISVAVTLANRKTLPFLSRIIARGNANNRQMFRKLHREAICGHARNIRQYYEYSVKYRCTSELQNIQVPILLVYGTKDKSFHPYARMLHEKLPSNELVFLAVHHQIPTKAAATLNNEIDAFICNNSV
ncbi:alpha/beta hydrolase [Lysinibacillus sp. KU-BSD001]|uniref:alpha/beta fold hydrolase n=1 Tax=Lysinibacillus sp. KU-BSD001 TaxID=3141328 RepID=UPI0036E279A5